MTTEFDFQTDNQKREAVDSLLSSGKYRHDRHGHLLPFASRDFVADEYDQFADELWAKNQELYESFWGPVPWLHPDDFDERLAEWLAAPEACECIRGKTLMGGVTESGDSVTRRWIYNPSDVAAIRAGFRFDEDRARKTLEFVTGQLILYEGEYAGKYFRPMAWQVELFCRMDGWVRFDEEWGREVRRFRKVMVFEPKKNGKSPTGAAVGLKLTIAEQEKGAKVFSAAKDGTQAKVIHDHARQFVKKHDTGHGKYNRLGCSINKTSGEIYHEATESYYRLLAADNIDAQEGKNGSVIIDETHVVDERLAKVLEYMGASRPEPMQFEISTTGRDQLAYGKGQYDYGQLVETGEIIDHQVLFMGFGVFSAPHIAERTPEGVDYEDERTWQRVNPSWFVTIKPSEFKTSFARAKQKGKSHFDTFCMYRLNKWLSGGSPWLDVADWIACGQAWDLNQKAGHDCVVGVDLSRTRDMSAITVTINDGANCWQRTYLWITERYVDQWRERMPQWDNWAAAERVVIVPGDLIDYEALYAELSEINEIAKIKGVVYDPTYASGLIKWCGDNLRQAELVQFDQAAATYEGRLDDYEAAVKERTLIHDGNPCMTWQAGHCETKPNARGCRILVKPSGKDDPRKIDGMVSSVMSRFGAMSLDIAPSVYQRRGVLTV